MPGVDPDHSRFSNIKPHTYLMRQAKPCILYEQSQNAVGHDNSRRQYDNDQQIEFLDDFSWNLIISHSIFDVQGCLRTLHTSTGPH